jgi:glycosyltransferase involved in cell wall biosynthesis
VDYASVRRQSEEPLTDPWFEEDVDVVLAVGRLTAQKDFETLIRAVAALPEVRLLVLGEGEERARLAALVAELGVADRVRLHGFVANPYPYFARASVIALSSRWEGLPTVLLEALPFDARIVSTDCPSGPQEILQRGTYGRLVPMEDPEALARAIDEARAEPPADRSEAWSRYDLTTAVSDYEAVIDDVVRRRSGR